MDVLPKRKYAPEFRAEAVKLVQSGVAQAEVARRLGRRDGDPSAQNSVTHVAG